MGFCSFCLFTFTIFPIKNDEPIQSSLLCKMLLGKKWQFIFVVFHLFETNRRRSEREEYWIEGMWWMINWRSFPQNEIRDKKLWQKIIFLETIFLLFLYLIESIYHNTLNGNWDRNKCWGIIFFILFVFFKIM